MKAVLIFTLGINFCPKLLAQLFMSHQNVDLISLVIIASIALSSVSPILISLARGSEILAKNLPQPDKCCLSHQLACKGSEVDHNCQLDCASVMVGSAWWVWPRWRIWQRLTRLGEKQRWALSHFTLKISWLPLNSFCYFSLCPFIIAMQCWHHSPVKTKTCIQCKAKALPPTPTSPQQYSMLISWCHSGDYKNGCKHRRLSALL